MLRLQLKPQHDKNKDGCRGAIFVDPRFQLRHTSLPHFLRRCAHAAQLQLLQGLCRAFSPSLTNHQSAGTKLTTESLEWSSLSLGQGWRPIPVRFRETLAAAAACRKSQTARAFASQHWLPVTDISAWSKHSSLRFMRCASSESCPR